MIGGLIVTHGRLAIELLNAAEMIVGEIHHITAVSLGWHDDVDMATTMIQKALDRVRGPDGVLILTDMFGGTPTNICSTFLDPGTVEVVIGHRLGLHARAAAKLVQLSSQYQSTIVLFRSDAANVANSLEADARSILSILLLSAGFGARIGVRADGVDENQAVDTICEYLAG